MEPTPDLSSAFAVHDGMRADLRRAVDAIEAAREDERTGLLSPLARWADAFGDELRRHHVVEDEIVFRDLAARVPSVGPIVADLESDRRVVDRLIAEWQHAVAALADRRQPFPPCHRRAGDAVSALDDALSRRLDIEDDDVLPLFYRHYSATEYDALRRRASEAQHREDTP